MVGVTPAGIFDLSRAGWALYDVRGRRVAVLRNSTWSSNGSGRYDAALDVPEEIRSGFYVLALTRRVADTNPFGPTDPTAEILTTRRLVLIR